MDVKDATNNLASLKHLISGSLAHRLRVVPSEENADGIVFLTDSSIEDSLAKKELRITTGKPVSFSHIEAYDLNILLNKYYDSGVVASRAFDPSANNFVSSLIKEALRIDASDIHVEPFEKTARIRFRVNGRLIERYSFSKDKYPELINKIKIESRLDIAEKRKPQDGRIKLEDQRDLDLRVSVLPAHYGEKAVLRLLSADTSKLDISRLGFGEAEYREYRRAIDKPNGIVLISGPTGSGKTTTLYATLKELNTEQNNIVTIEDPIEYTLDGINQVQLHEKIGLDFTAAMRAFLRQDPDIIMVGEIRDLDTAKMAIRAALTGHLVFSTIHTNSAWGIFSRLVEMGIPPYLLAETLNAGVAQRLIRILCDQCKVKSHDMSTLPDWLQERMDHHFVPVGCETCIGTGYSSRKAIYEIVPGSKELLSLYNSSRSIDAYLSGFGLQDLSHNAVDVFVNGETSYMEIAPFLL